MPRGNGGPRGLPGLIIPRSAVGPYDDFFDGSTFNPKWTLSGTSPGPVVSGGHVSFSTLAQSRYITQSGLSIPSSARLYARITGLSAQGGMIGIFMLDSSGNGVACSQYNGPSATYTWTITTYAYNSTGQSTAVGGSDFWLRLRKSGTSYYVATANHDATRSFDLQPYGTESTAITNASTVSQIGFGQMYTGSYTVNLEEFRYLPS